MARFVIANTGELPLTLSGYIDAPKELNPGECFGWFVVASGYVEVAAEAGAGLSITNSGDEDLFLDGVLVPPHTRFPMEGSFTATGATMALSAQVAG